MNYVGREFMCHLHHNVYVILLMTTNCYVFNFVCLEAETNSLIMEMEYVICFVNMRFSAHLWPEPVRKLQAQPFTQNECIVKPKATK